jgi:hypothetical protein
VSAANAHAGDTISSGTAATAATKQRPALPLTGPWRCRPIWSRTNPGHRKLFIGSQTFVTSCRDEDRRAERRT